MTAATRTRHLHPVPDLTGTPTPATDPAVRAATTLVHRASALAEAHDTACQAALAPDVATEQEAAITKLMGRLAKPGADIHALLRDYGRALYVHGHMDGAASTRQDALAELTLASITSIERGREAGDPA